MSPGPGAPVSPGKLSNKVERTPRNDSVKVVLFDVSDICEGNSPSWPWTGPWREEIRRKKSRTAKKHYKRTNDELRFWLPERATSDTWLGAGLD
jgi:hypothetical protein